MPDMPSWDSITIPTMTPIQKIFFGSGAIWGLVEKEDWAHLNICLSEFYDFDSMIGDAYHKIHSHNPAEWFKGFKELKDAMYLIPYMISDCAKVH